MKIPTWYRALCCAILIAVIPAFSSAQDATHTVGEIVVPGNIVMTGATCVDGSGIAATVDVDDASGSEDVVYTIAQPDDSGAWSVVANLTDPSVAWGEFDASVWLAQADGTLVASGVAAVPACEGPAPTDSTPSAETPSASRAGVISPMAASCPAAPTGTDLGSDTVTSALATSYDWDGNVVDTSEDGHIELPWQAEIQIDYTFDAGNPSSGDFLTVPLPPGLKTPDLSRTITVEGGTDPIACMTVVDGLVTVVFLDYVDTHDDITGKFWLKYSAEEFIGEEDVPTTTVITGIGEITINYQGSGPVGPDQEFAKGGFWYDSSQGANDPIGALQWYISIPQQAVNEVDITVTDVPMGTNWAPNCDFEPWFEKVPYEAWDPGELEYTFSCDPATGWSFHITRVPTDASVRILVRSDMLDPVGPYVNYAEMTQVGHETQEVTVRVIKGDGVGDGSGTTPTPVTPTPVTPTPVTPTETPVTPTGTPVTPTETPVTPTETPVTPTETPVTPTETPVTPTETPVTPTETPVTPTETPVTPTETPVTPTETPVTPTETPVTPTETPVTPTETPVTPTETPVTPTETPIIPGPPNPHGATETPTPVTPTSPPITPTPTDPSAPLTPTPGDPASTPPPVGNLPNSGAGVGASKQGLVIAVAALALMLATAMVGAVKRRDNS